MATWEIRGRELANCNCDSGCLCQFMSLPTTGTCKAVAGFEFDTGYYGDVDLGGTKVVMVLSWPGPIHEGNGTMQLIIDEAASPAQRDALQKIITGEDTNDMATIFWVFSAMSPNKLETLYLLIEMDIDVDGRTGWISAPGVFETSAEPLKNPVTGDPHQARINLPHGFEYRIAEIATGTTKTSGQINLPKNDGTHAHFVDIHLSVTGVLEAA